jgi:hypothetical protein
MNASAPNSLSASRSVNTDSVFLLVAIFSTIENGWPGFTRVILKKVEPKSNPITFASAVEEKKTMIDSTSKVDTLSVF